MLASLGPRGPLRDSGASDLGRAGSGTGDRVPSSSSMSSRSDRDSWLFISESVSASKAVPPPSRLLSEPLSEPSLALAESWLESDSKPSLRSLSSPALGGWRRRRRQERRENFRLFLTSPAGGAVGGGSGPGTSSFSKGSSVPRGQSGGAWGQTGAIHHLPSPPCAPLPVTAHQPVLPMCTPPPSPAPVPSVWTSPPPACTCAVTLDQPPRPHLHLCRRSGPAPTKPALVLSLWNNPPHLHLCLCRRSGPAPPPRLHLCRHSDQPHPPTCTCALALECRPGVLALLQLRLQPYVDVVDEVREERQREGNGCAVLLGP